MIRSISHFVCQECDINEPYAVIPCVWCSNVCCIHLINEITCFSCDVIGEVKWPNWRYRFWLNEQLIEGKIMPAGDIVDKINSIKLEIDEARKKSTSSADFSDDPTNDDCSKIMDPISAAAYQLIAEHATDMVSVHSIDGRYVFASSACKRILGYNPSELMGVNVYDMFHPDDENRVKDHQVNGITLSEAPSITYRIKCKNGTYRWVETTSRNHSSIIGSEKIIAITRDVSERERLVRQLEESNKRLMEIASQDELTNISNRRAFNERLSYLMMDYKRGRGFSLIVCDIDNFKKFNDLYGHQAGDEVIAMVAKTIVGECRGVDLVARYGGEEFAMLLPGTDLNGAMVLAERTRLAIEYMGASYGKITMSFGVCAMSDLIDDEKGVFAIADKALYRAKSKGRNRVECL
jgi:diguanylate cyclase (GGDEF)-like protein/PAS domain S-box-containing protein